MFYIWNFWNDSSEKEYECAEDMWLDYLLFEMLIKIS